MIGPPVNLKSKPYIPRQMIDWLEKEEVPLDYISDEDLSNFYYVPTEYPYGKKVWQENVIGGIINRYYEEKHEKSKEYKTSKYGQLCEKYLEVKNGC